MKHFIVFYKTNNGNSVLPLYFDGNTYSDAAWRFANNRVISADDMGSNEVESSDDLMVFITQIFNEKNYECIGLVESKSSISYIEP